jgi:biopolymer transport protein ExbD
MSEPHINVTPLIDVLLVLLIIFMVVTPMKPSAFDAKIPQRPDEDRILPTRPDTLVVIVNRDSTLKLNAEELGATVTEPERLTSRLAQVFDLRQRDLPFSPEGSGGLGEVNTTVFIRAPRSMDYGSVAKIVDAVKLAGADPVSLQIDNLE